MRKLDRRAKSESLNTNGRTQRDQDWSFYRIDVGGVVGISFVTFLALVFGIALTGAPQPIIPAVAATPVPPPQPTPQTLLPLTLDELLMAMAQRLQARGIAAEVKHEDSILRVMTSGPMYPLSKAKLEPQQQVDADGVASVLAWAISCHVDFATDDMWQLEPMPPDACSREPEPAEPPTSTSCLADRGRVALAALRFEGHADAVPFRPQTRGPYRDNEALSQGRSQDFARRVVGCARKHLSHTGQDNAGAGRTSAEVPYATQGLGAQQPAFSNGRDPRNRRVEILFREKPTSLEIEGWEDGTAGR